MKKVTIMGVALFLSACASVQTMPLAPNMVRIDTRARGLIAQSQAVPQTMRTAAKETIDRGYTHFRFADANLGQGEVYAGSIGNVSGSYGQGNYNAWGSSTAINAPVTNAAVTVIMFKANEPGAKGAFNAQEIYLKYQ